MDDRTLEKILERAGFTVDNGDVIGGPFIPDGTVRVYEADSFTRVIGEGKTLAEACSMLDLDNLYGDD